MGIEMHVEMDMEFTKFGHDMSHDEDSKCSPLQLVVIMFWSGRSLLFG